MTLHLGIAFGAIAAFASLMAILTWWTRSRAQSRRRALENNVSWPWDRDAPGEIDSGRDRLERGSRHLTSMDIWGKSEPKLPSLCSVLDKDCPSNAAEINRQDRSVFPLPPTKAHHDPRIADPYPTVQINRGNRSVPDLAPDLGQLQVTNLLPGDVSSSDEGNHSVTSLGVFSSISPASDYGTPYPTMVKTRPRFHGLDAGGLPVPWGPLQSSRQDLTTGGLQRDREAHSRLPGEPGMPLRASSSEGWAASIKSNLFNAFSAVVSSQSGPGEEPPDNLTRKYIRNRHSPRQRKTHSREGMLSRGSSVHSVTSSVKEWSEEETCEGAGVVHFLIPEGSDDVLSPERAREVQKPPPAVIKSRDREPDRLSPGPLENAMSADDAPKSSSISYTAETHSTLVDRTQFSTPMAGHEEATTISQIRSRRERRTKARRPKRPVLVTRKSSSLSVGSDMSRTSSISTERLTDAERFASKALRERRRRVLEMGAGRGKPGHVSSGSRRVRKADD